MQKLEKWLKENKLSYNFSNTFEFITFNIEGFEGSFIYLERDDNELIFNGNESINFIMYKNEIDYCNEHNVDFAVFEFGEKFYYTNFKDYPNFSLNLLRDLGNAKQLRILNYCNLAVHGGYELLNGSGSYNDWCLRAKFFGHTSIGICETNTLAALLAFQTYAVNNNLKPIFGETINVKFDDYIFQAKIYVKNKIGWKNLLRIHKNINVDGDGSGIHILDLQKHSEGIIFILPQDYDFSNSYNESLFDTFEHIYYQIDSTIWRSNRRDQEFLKALKNYVDNYYHIVSPVMISDSYYIEKSDFEVKRVLNKIGDVKFQFSSNNQFFKNVDDIFEVYGEIFERKNDILEKSIENTMVISDLCDFKIDTSHFRLPKYELTEQEKEQFGNSESLFEYLMEEGLSRKVDSEKYEQYRERLDEEIRVIKLGGFIDYFLILWDIMQWCKKEGILRGIGRGSAAGSLISYLLDITEADPIEYDLLFERFLNESRIGNYKDIEYVVLEDGEGNAKEIKSDTWVDVLRENKKINILASKIIENDVIL